MSDQNIMAALQIHLKAFADARSLRIAYEGRPFTPENDKTHLADYLLPADTMSPSMGRAHSRYVGIYQVTVDAPAGDPVTLRKLANDLAAHFPRGLSLTNLGQTVLITHAPSIGPLIPGSGRATRPVSIRYQSDVIA